MGFATSDNIFVCPDEKLPSGSEILAANLPTGTTWVDGKGYSVAMTGTGTSGTPASPAAVSPTVAAAYPTITQVYYFFAYVPNTKLKKFLNDQRKSLAPTSTEIKVRIDAFTSLPAYTPLTVEMRTTNAELKIGRAHV